ncbi:hypothetical protein EYB25_000151 [Talaromyces marneffei]|uniref:Uncharacterized protein n=1 Tax=Talaromyces marneffei (strain ATCC 18224 / CBS 334.59 / QM 7333) TaxID=441960 RepID=B6Q1T7_TALMQ|nr:uncharacterized protein EYB26_002202 [Talaromyces marneffei]EEA28940.1 conserved hypothetical protein [Talaromyces marneffei ATCC 18224]KAE8555455.1 hypothetical protein EYB25_000151 [Talaromyces marneffei]QGA14547.1 hypothetical protein EYB26_002202 [Talaromyces marneffei]
MSSQHLYTLADQLGVFDSELDLDLKKPHDNVEKHGEKEDFTYSALESPNISETNTLPIESTSRWTIGWVTPSAILSCFLMAVTLAIAHLGLFRWLNERQVDDSINQPYVTALSYFFVNGFRLLLAASLGISFVQIVWQLLRVKPIQLGELDGLLSVLSNPLQLGRVSLFWRAPVPFLCAIAFWCLPIAMVFPPGALTVETRSLTNITEQAVPTFDPTFVGNGTYNGMLATALWQTDNLGAYGGPANIVRRLATQSMLAGSYITSPSPCGQNCSYTIDVNAPTFQCNESSVSSDLFSWVNHTYPQYGAFRYIYAAHANSAALVESPYNFNFQLSWSNGGLTGRLQNLSCTAYEAVYTLRIDYREGLQTVTTTNTQLGPMLNSSNLYTDYGMRPVNGGNGTDPIVDATSTALGGDNVMDSNRRANMAAIQDTLADSLSGFIDALLLHAQQTANTLIALTDLYSGPTTSPTFDITEESMKHLLENIVISMLTLNQTTTQTNVTQAITVNVFSFSNPERLIVPYFLSACISLAFIIGGGHALLSNGISASTGGLFQTLCTTRGSERLGDLAAKGCLGGRENVPEDLKNLKVMFGVFKNSEDSSNKPMAGLGTVDEVIPLVKGAF